MGLENPNNFKKRSPEMDKIDEAEKHPPLMPPAQPSLEAQIASFSALREKKSFPGKKAKALSHARRQAEQAKRAYGEKGPYWKDKD